MATKVQSVQSALARKLPGFTPSHVKSIAQTIAVLQAKGLSVDDVFPQGQFNPDGLTIGGHLAAADVLKLGELVAAIGPLKGVQVFPRGIPMHPDVLRVELTLHK